MYDNFDKTAVFLRGLLSDDKPKCLLELEDYATRNLIPILLSESANFLRQIVTITQPKKILEIGTAIGYSGLIMLSSSNARLYSMDMSEESLAVAREFFDSNGYHDRVTLLTGDAGEIIPLMDGNFDFIFLDGPKSKYLEYLPYLKKLLSHNGILLCDNVLFKGMIADESKAITKKNSIVNKLRKFLDVISHDPDFLTSVLPIGDGMSLSYKVGSDEVAEGNKII